MAAVRIGAKHQVTIPQPVREALNLSAGDFLDAAAEGGRIVLTPLQLSAKAPAPRLTAWSARGHDSRPDETLRRRLHGALPVGAPAGRQRAGPFAGESPPPRFRPRR